MAMAATVRGVTVIFVVVLMSIRLVQRLQAARHFSLNFFMHVHFGLGDSGPNNVKHD